MNEKNVLIEIVGGGDKDYALKVMRRILVAHSYYTINSERADAAGEIAEDTLFAIEDMIKHIEGE